MRRRAEAERATAVSEERNLQLLRYGAELDHVVEERKAPEVLYTTGLPGEQVRTSGPVAQRRLFAMLRYHF